MTFTTSHMSVSLDGFVAGPDQTVENPIGRGGMALHQWHLNHEPIELAGGTTFYFVTDGFDTALRLAREAGEGDVDIAGGASTVRQALHSGELDELTLDIAPVLLGSGEPLFDAEMKLELEPVEAEHSPWATHV